MKISVKYNLQLIGLVSICCLSLVSSQLFQTKSANENNEDTNGNNSNNNNVPCTCGVFMSGQFKKGANEQPKGSPAFIQEQEIVFPCGPLGTKMCVNKCLDSIVKFLPNSSKLICGSLDRDCFKERAFLFVQNCSPLWSNSNLSAGREFCCKDSEPYKCGFAPKA